MTVQSLAFSKMSEWNAAVIGTRYVELVSGTCIYKQVDMAEAGFSGYRCAGGNRLLRVSAS
jgi:hypothetical protein